MKIAGKQIQDDSVDSLQIKDHSIADVDIADNAAIALTKIDGLDSSLANKWALGGNATTTTQSIGTTANQILNFLQNNATRMQFATDGSVSFPGKVTANPILGIANHTVTATSDISTTSTTAILATGMTYTPVAGTYLCFFTGTVYQNLTSMGRYIETSIYSGDTLNDASRVQIANTTRTSFANVAIVTVNGTQAIEGRWLRNVDTLTINMVGTRSLTIIRLA